MSVGYEISCRNHRTVADWYGVIAKIVEVIGFGMKVVRKPSPAIKYSYNGMLVPRVNVNISYRIQTCRVPVLEACRTYRIVGYG